MKSIIVAILALCMASTAVAAATPVRKRTASQHKSSPANSITSDERYDPYLGMDEQQHRQLQSMSMPMCMSMAPTKKPTAPSFTPPTPVDPPTPTPPTPTPPTTETERSPPSG